MKYAGPIAAAERRIVDRLPSLVDEMFALAAGVMVQESTRDGPRIYTTAPCFKSISYLIDRILGKPRQAIELSGEDGAPVEIEAVLSGLSSDDLNALESVAAKLALASALAGRPAPPADEGPGGDVPAQPR